MKLIPEARRAWRMLSIHVASVAVMFGLLPPDQQSALLEFIGVPTSRVPAILGLLFIAARLINQNAAQAPKE